MFTAIALVLTAMMVVVFPVILVDTEYAIVFVSMEVFFAIVLAPALLTSALSSAGKRGRPTISPEFTRLYAQITWLAACIVTLIAAVRRRNAPVCHLTHGNHGPA